MKLTKPKGSRNYKAMLIVLLLAFNFSAQAQWDFSTNYFKIHINNKGYITSMKNTTVSPNREFSPTDKLSPLMSLYDGKKKTYYLPTKASYDKTGKLITLNFPNGSLAKISLEPKKKYFKLTLKSLTKREGIEDVQWGSYHTNITNLMGEIIGVARDTTAVVNYSIGMFALNDNTLGGTSDTEGD